MNGNPNDHKKYVVPTYSVDMRCMNCGHVSTFSPKQGTPVHEYLKGIGAVCYFCDCPDARWQVVKNG